MFRGTPFEDFFKDSQPGPQETPRFRPKARGQGSGIVMARDGYILTNNHVVENASKVEVTLQDGDPYEAEIVGRDEEDGRGGRQDRRVGPARGRFRRLGRRGTGDSAVAIGSPFHLDYTVTVGVIEREEPDEREPGASVRRLSSDGRVDQPGQQRRSAVRCRRRSDRREHDDRRHECGIGFAISADMARSVADQLIEHGEVSARTSAWASSRCAPTCAS